MDEFRASRPLLESTLASAKPSVVKLKLNPEPRLTYFPEMARDPEQIAPDLRETIKALVNGKAPWPLFLHGPAGVGKTCAALCVLDRAYSIGAYRVEIEGKEFYTVDQPSGIYRTAQEICDVLFSEHGKVRRTKTDATWKEWTEARLAVLDELGSREKVGDFVYNTTKALLDVRAGKPLIVISNLDLAALAVLYDDRITSRLASGTVVKVDGEDRRIKR